MVGKLADMLNAEIVLGKVSIKMIYFVLNDDTFASTNPSLFLGFQGCVQ